jgi:hypothetical protein
MSDPTHAEVTLHVPRGGIPMGVVAAVGSSHGLPEAMLTSEARHILLVGGRIVLSSDDADGGRINNWNAREWSQHLDGIDVDATWCQGTDYVPGSEHVRAGALHAYAEMDGEPVLTLRRLVELREQGKSLDEAIDALLTTPVAYETGDLETEVDLSPGSPP